jgi:hypothetical protein
MSRKEELLAEGYGVNEFGVITDPGKFEGEPLWVVYFYEQMLEGSGDDWGGGAGETVFTVSAEDRKEFPELEDIGTVIIWESDQGFVNKATFAPDEEIPEPEYEEEEEEEEGDF